MRARLLAVLFPLLLVTVSLVPSPARAQDRVMMQGFYWDVTPGGVWYDTLTTRAARLSWAGFDAIWLPPVSKGAASQWDVGYTPYDYYDLGEYDSCGGNGTQGQGGCVPTRYGTRAGLEEAIQTLKSRGLQVYADIVLNHRSGGSPESNPYVGYFTWGGGSLVSSDGKTYTAFPLTYGSGRVAWPAGGGAEFFYPNASVNPGNTWDFYSEEQLAGFHRLYTNGFSYDNALHDGYGNNLPLGDSLMVWGDWLTTTLGLDGYRFDFVKGIHPEYLKRWVDYGAMRGKFHVHELYDGDIGRLDAYYNLVKGSQQQPAVFDFNLRFAYKNVLDGNAPIYTWQDAGLINKYGFPFEAIVSFVDNHDFDRIDYTGHAGMSDHSPIVNNKMLAYAHMLTHPGYATVWWRDYFNYGLGAEIDELIRIRKAFASGDYYALTRGETGSPYWGGPNPANPWDHLYVGQRNGDGPNRGLIVAINKHPNQWAEVWVTQQNGAWRGQTLRDVTGRAGGGTTTVAHDGRVRVWAPPNSYTVWVPEGYAFAAAPPMPSPDVPSYHAVNHVNLQWPAAVTIPAGEAETFYARIYAHGRTNAAGAGGGIEAWIGYSTQNTDPATWTNWIPAAFGGVRGHASEYAAALSLPEGSYYVASRFRLDGGAYQYGGYSTAGGGAWDGSRFTSSTLTVMNPLHASCDDLASAPAYAGGYALNAAGTRAFVRVTAPAGGTTFTFYRTSNLEVDDPVAGVENTTALPGFTRDGLTFTFSAGSEPAEVYFPIRTAGTKSNSVAFFLKVTDTCGRTVDVDPQFALDAAAGDGLAGFALAPSRPNPTAGAATIRFSTEEAAHVRLSVYDVLGREVARLVDETLTSGTHEAAFDGSALPSGVYMYRLESAGQIRTRTFTLAR